MQFYTLIAMIGMGSYFGAALDTYNRFLKRSTRKGWIVFINDFLFWVVQALSIFYVLFLVNEGELRFYLFLALLLGFSAYQALLKRIYTALLDKLIMLFIAAANFIARTIQALIFRPIKWMLATLIFIILGIGKAIFSLLKTFIRLILSIICILAGPLLWIFKEFWDFLPKSVTNVVAKFYNECKGIVSGTKNLIKNVITKWKNKSG
ncbi:spore cortex biosynthesis protein YabQ [Peribacillus sp. SCS-155]|uniref:spore cortex biosynthesis protein YabQ n=1 Tax=Peribacillus sedimenti TaxID=3115297 RepID=UPI0039064107